VYLQVPLVRITLACPAHPPSHGDKSGLASNLKWIHMTGAGIEHVMPLDWLPTSKVLTYKSGVHAPKAGQFAVTAASRWSAARGGSGCVRFRDVAAGFAALVRAQRHTDTPCLFRRRGQFWPLTIDLVFENMASWVAGKPFRNIIDRNLRY